MENVSLKFAVKLILIEKKNFITFSQKISLMTPITISKRSGKMKCLMLMENLITFSLSNQKLMKMKDKFLVSKSDMIGT